MQGNRFFMRLFTILTLLLFFTAERALAQTAIFNQPGTRAIHAYTDFYKTDYERPLRKLQAGFEVGYQLHQKLQITGGLEFWNRGPTPLVTIGNRFYPYGATFVRYRALIGRNADVGVGLGYSLQLGKRFLLEAASDYYLDQNEIGFRLSLGYLWRKTTE